MRETAKDNGFLKLCRSIVEYFQPTPERAESTLAEISHGSTPAPGYYALISAASLIASLGLVANSPAVVIGAMLVSPLMTPIFGIALGMIRGDALLFGRAVRAEVGGVVLAICFGAIFGTLPLSLEVTSEMLARTEPTLLDLLVAVFAGLAGTLAIIDERISPALPGVAISTAIVPPLATCGLCLAFGAYSGAYGAFLLFFANFMAILLVSSLVFIMGGLAAEENVLSRSQLLRRLFAAGLGFTVVAVVLTHTLLGMIENRERLHTIRSVFMQALQEKPTTSLDDVVYHESKGSLQVFATVRTPKVLSPDFVKSLQNKLTNELRMPAELIVRCLLAKDISSTGATRGVIAQDLDGRFVASELDPAAAKEQMAEQTLREIMSSRPDLLLLDVDLLYIAGSPVVLATVQSSRALIPYEVEQVEAQLRQRLNDPELILLARCQVPIDVTARGHILMGKAHFGKVSEDTPMVEREVKQAVARDGIFFAPNVDAVWDLDHWTVTAEIVGARMITSEDVQKIQTMVSQAVGQPVQLNAWARVELMVNDTRFMPLDEYTRSRLEAKERNPVSPRSDH